MEASELLGTIEAMHGEARQRALFFLRAEDDTIRGRTVTIDGRAAVSFASCSYLGLEHHPALVRGVHDAVDRWGTQFSASRGYLSAPPYEALEAQLSQVFGASALVTSSTSIGHQIALPVLVTERDALVLDHQVHHSVHMAATLVRAQGATVELVRHNALERAEELVARLARTHRTVWFACDGVFSMYGDLAPVGLLQRLLDVAPNVRLYVDDAHGMSWAGAHGRGSFLARFPMSERVVLATSLNKAYSAAGGCLVFADPAERERVRLCGGPMVFSGPIQPPMLGAALASAAVHLSDEIVALQSSLRDRVDLTNRMLREHALPLLVENESPIFFLRLGLPRVAFDVASRMKDDGYYLNVSMYPAVPMKRSGIRVAVTALHEPADIARMIERLAVHVPAVLAEHGVSRDELDALFEHAIPVEARDTGATPDAGAAKRLATLIGADLRPSVATPSVGVSNDNAEDVSLEVYDTITDVDRALWDQTLGGVGACSWEALRLAERVFDGHGRREHQWRFQYLVARDTQGAPVAVTFLTTSLVKDDMLMRDQVSQAVEARRKDDPYLLTSTAVMVGSQLSEGNHLWLDRQGPWRAAVTKVLAAAEAAQRRDDAGLVMVRDLPADDPAMDAFMLDAGFVKVPMFDSHTVDVDWADDAGLVARSRKRSRAMVRELVARVDDFPVRVWGAGADGPGDARLDPVACDRLFAMYRAVASRKLRLNVFELPRELVDAMQSSPAWEIVTVHLRADRGGPADDRPVAWFAAHVHGGDYAPFFCGLDYDYVYTQGAYRMMLLTILRRAKARGMTRVHLGMDADVEKGRFGTEVQKNCIYLRASDHFQGALLREITENVGVAARRGAA